MTLDIQQAKPETFRTALGSFASGVNVISVWDRRDRPYGMTASAFSSVSTNPLLVLICVDRSTRTYAEIRHRRRFGVNILSRDARDISEHCARPGADKVLRLGWLNEQTSGDRPPVLARAIAYLDVTLDRELEAGTHAVCLGSVTHVGVQRDADVVPLVYFRGRYHHLDVTMSAVS